MDIKMKTIKFPEIATEEQKTMLANITEMKDGKMTIMVDNKPVELNEALKSIGNDKEKLAELLKSGEPKDMLTLAKEQTSYQKDMANSLNALVSKPGAIIGGSKMGGKIMQAENQLKAGTADAFSKALDIGKLREGFDNNMGGISKALYRLTTGEGSFEDVGKELFETTKNIGVSFETVFADVKKNSSDLYKDIQAGNNEISKGIANVILGMGGLIKNADKGKGEEFFNGSVLPTVETKVNPIATVNGVSVDKLKETTTQTKSTETQITENNSTLSGDMTLNIKVDAPQGVDTKQLSLALNDPEVKARIIEILQKSVANNNTQKNK
jgi:hypothetical protein